MIDQLEKVAEALKKIFKLPSQPSQPPQGIDNAQHT